MPYRIVYELGGDKHVRYAEPDSLSGALEPEKPLAWRDIETGEEKVLTPSVAASVTRVAPENLPPVVRENAEKVKA